MNQNEMIEVFYGSVDYFLGLDYIIKKHPDNSRLRSCYEGTNIRDLVQCILFDRRKKVFKLDRYLKRPWRFILTSASGEITGVMVIMSLPEFYQKVGYEDYAVIGTETVSDYRKLLNHPSLANRVEVVAFNARQARLVAARFSVKETHYWSVFKYNGKTSGRSHVDSIRLMNAGDFDLAKQLSKGLAESSPLRLLRFQLKGLPYKNYVLSFDSVDLVFIGICPSSTGVYQISYSVVSPADRALLPAAIEAVGRLVKNSGGELIWKIKTKDVPENKSLIKKSGFIKVFDERHLHLNGSSRTRKGNRTNHVRSMAMHTRTEVNDACEEFEQEIGPDTTFVLPQNTSERNVLGKHLVIAPEYANWLVCDEEEYEALCLIKSGKNLQEVWEGLCGQGTSADKATTIISLVAAQILGKEFEQKAVVTEKKIFKVATLFITAGCNLRCSTCVFGATVAGTNECSFVDWKRFFKAFVNMGGQTVTLTGGEPMTNPDFEKIVICAKDLGLQVVVITNATLINEENVQLLGIKCDEVQVSIDGPDEKTHDSVRGKGTFKKALASLRKLSIYPSCRLSIAMTPTLATIPVFQTELHRFAKWVRKSIRKDISIRVSRRIGKGRRIPSLSVPDQDVYRRAVLAMCDDQLERGFTDKLDTATIVPNRRKVGCGIGDFLTVTADGEIKLCEFFPDSFGNIKELEKNKNLLGTVAKRIEGISRSLRVEELSACSQCDLRYFCGGKCRRDNNRDCGDSKVCKCDDEYKTSWYERLVRVSPYVVQPVV